MSLSKYYQNDVFVTYTFSFTPSYKIPKGSIIVISLPTTPAGLNYNHINLSTPPATCDVSDSNYLDKLTCSLSATSIEVTTSSSNDIPASTPLTLFIHGAKNPNYSGPVDEGKFKITAQLPLPDSHKINESNFAAFSFLDQKSA